MGVLLAMERTEISIDVEVEGKLAEWAGDHSFVTRPCQVTNNPLDCNGMGLFGLGIEVTNLTDGEGNVGATVA